MFAKIKLLQIYIKNADITKGNVDNETLIDLEEILKRRVQVVLNKGDAEVDNYIGRFER